MRTHKKKIFKKKIIFQTNNTQARHNGKSYTEMTKTNKTNNYVVNCCPNVY